MLERIYLEVEPSEAKMRLEDFLLKRFQTMSKIYLREIVRDEKCEVNGEFQNRGYKLRSKDFIEIEVETGDRNVIEPENIPLEIIFEDEDILVVNKKAGMLVHPSKRVRSGTLLNAAAYHLNRNSNGKKYVRAGLIHRLDKETSGVLLLAKHPLALQILCRHFQRKLVSKRYFALVKGRVGQASGTISAPIGRYVESRFWDVKNDGKEAETNFWVIERYENSTLVELEPVTGRTNQLRIHLAHIGHPILGDTKYQGAEFSRMCLHAYKLGFHHPNGHGWMEFETKADFVETSTKN
ncbi:MAG: RluA family pseudouridine synthase [Pyrinomonadaceae bacterium]|nr:RluA family pseudouridine synthase [Pyrinomonadaceae bacterium]